MLSAIVVFLVGVGFVIAIGSGNYQIQGHDFSELQKCSANQILKADANGNWACANAGEFSFGAETKKDSLGNSIVTNTLYQVTSDGFLIFVQGVGYIISIKMGPTSSPPQRFNVYGILGTGGTFPIHKNEYFIIETSADLNYISYQPIGSGVVIKQ